MRQRKLVLSFDFFEMRYNQTDSSEGRRNEVELTSLSPFLSFKSPPNRLKLACNFAVGIFFELRQTLTWPSNAGQLLLFVRNGFLLKLLFIGFLRIEAKLFSAHQVACFSRLILQPLLSLFASTRFKTNLLIFSSLSFQVRSEAETDSHVLRAN